MARLKPEDRRARILEHAVEAARSIGYQHITRDEVARRAAVSVGLVTRYFGTMPKLKRAVMRAAIQGEVLEVVAQGLAAADPHARKAPNDLKQRAIATF